MTLNKRFVRADVREVRPSVWLAKITYSYFGMYEYEESNISNSVNDALRWIANERCGGELQIVNVQNVVV